MKKTIQALAATLFFATTLQAQLPSAEKKAAVDSIIATLHTYYVFPEVAVKIESYLRSRQAAGAYDTIGSGPAFATLLTNDIRAINNDRHLGVQYSAEPLNTGRADLLEIPAEEKEGYALWLLSQNYGVRKLEVLPGNIGYIDFAFFCGPEYGGDTYAAALNYINHTDALILDLRQCSGAMSPEVIPFICSYFFERSTHLNNIYWRKDDKTVQSWTHAMVPGKKYLGKPIYILTSRRTFSGAEELAYDLKNLKRATIVGEITGGGANPGGTINVTSHFTMFVPNGRAISPITQTNWEGVGVQPDTLTKKSEALYKARLLALQHLLGTIKHPGRQAELKDLLAKAEKEKPVYKSVSFTLPGYANAKEVFVSGYFNDWSPTANPMKRVGKNWVVTVETEMGKQLYKFVVDGNWIIDPGNKNTEMENGYINSVIIVGDNSKSF